MPSTSTAIHWVIDKSKVNGAFAPLRYRHSLRDTSEMGAHGLDDDDPKSECDKDLILVWAFIVIADEDALDDHPQQKRNDRTRGNGDQERLGGRTCDIRSVGANHIKGAVREIDHSEGAKDNGKPHCDQHKQCAEREPIE